MMKGVKVKSARHSFRRQRSREAGSGTKYWRDSTSRSPSPTSGSSTNGGTSKERSYTVPPPLRPRTDTANSAVTAVPSVDFGHLPSPYSFHWARTFGSDDNIDKAFDTSSVEEGLCYVVQEPSIQPHVINFEDLHDFVDKQNDGQRLKHDRRTSYSCETAKMTKSKGSPPPWKPPLERIESGDSSLTMIDEKKPVTSYSAVSMGLPPPQIDRQNRFSFFSTGLEGSIHSPNLGDLLLPGQTFQELFELGPEGGCWWLDMMMPTPDEVEAICEAFNVHDLTREDVTQQEVCEKVELFKTYYFVCFNSFHQVDQADERYLEPVNTYAIVFREGIITLAFGPSPHAANVRRRLGRLRDYVSVGADWICYALIDDIVDKFGPVIRFLGHESDTIEDNVFTARFEDSRELLKQISHCRKKNMKLTRLLDGKADVIKGFSKRCNETVLSAPRQEVALYLSDVHDHVVTMMSNLKHFDQMLSRSHSNYLAQISVDSIAQGTQCNEFLGRVTFIGTILVPMNLVCGLFGMNVPVPGGVSPGDLYWFFAIVGFLAAFVASSIIVARRLRMI